jgi:phosphate transport system substrate-binding protein
VVAADLLLILWTHSVYSARVQPVPFILKTPVENELVIMKRLLSMPIRRQILILIVTMMVAPILLPAWVLAGSSLAAETVRINGSGSSLNMLKPMVEAFRKTNRDIRIEIEKPLGSSGAIRALMAGALEVVASSRALKPEEVAQEAQLREYGRTPLVIVSEKSVQKLNITTKELEEIYTGSNSKWQNGETIRLVIRPREDMDTQILRGLSPGMNNAVTASLLRPGMLVAVTDLDAYKTISKTPGALGASGLTNIITEKPTLNILTLNGVAPTPTNLANRSYPLSKEINFVTSSRTTRDAHKFIDFVYSPQGRAIASKVGVLVTAEKKVNK